MEPRLPYSHRNQRTLARDEKFRFGCHRGLDCFTRCCADVNILLTPYDVLRLSRRQQLDTSEFLRRHTITPFTKELGLPLVVLRMNDDEKKTCPFVGPEGCQVYLERPWACRMYPLGMALPPARAGVQPQPVFFLFQDDFCLGRSEAGEWTVDGWRRDQQVDRQESLEAGWREVVCHPWFIGGRQLDIRRIDMYYTACYDLDALRRFVMETSFLKRFEIDAGLEEKLRHDDEELLRFAFVWLRFALFGEPTLKTRGTQPDPPGRTT